MLHHSPIRPLSAVLADYCRLTFELLCFGTQLTYEAEGKVNEAREVIETIIKENRGMYRLIEYIAID